MSLIGEALYTLLTNDSNVTNLVSTRIWPNKLQINASYPAITYQKISSPRVYSNDGATGFAQPRYEINCWSKTYSEVQDLADKVRQAIEANRSTTDGIRIEGIFLEDEGDEYEDETELHRVRMDFVIHHAE